MAFSDPAAPPATSWTAPPRVGRRTQLRPLRLPLLLALVLFAVLCRAPAAALGGSAAWVAAPCRAPRRGCLLGLLPAALVAGPAAASGPEEPEDDLPNATPRRALDLGLGERQDYKGGIRVVDDAKTFSPSTRTALERLSEGVERTSGVKLFVLALTPEQRAPSSLGELKKRLEMDSSSIAMIVAPGAARDGRIAITRGSRVAEQFQYKLTTAHDRSTEKALGSEKYVEKYGIDVAVSQAAENMAACLYLATEDPSSFECSTFVLGESRVRDVLAAKGITATPTP